MYGLLGGGPNYGGRDAATEDQNGNGSAAKAETDYPSSAKSVNRLNAPAQPIHGRTAAKDDVSSERE
jgi:hypothetical protein